MIAATPTSACRVCATRDVILVEDDGSVRRALDRILRAGGYRVIAYDSGDALLQAQRRVQPTDRCIVCDIRLPGVSGFELHHRLTARGATPPWIFITGHDDAAVRAQAARLGAGYLPKPFAARALLDLITPLSGSSDPASPAGTQTPNG